MGEKLDATCRDLLCANRGTYALPGRCTNCGWQGQVIYTRGHEASRTRCEECDCKTVTRRFDGVGEGADRAGAATADEPDAAPQTATPPAAKVGAPPHAEANAT